MRHVPYADLARGRAERARDRAERQARGLRYVGLVWVSVTTSYGDGDVTRTEPMQLYRERGQTGDHCLWVRWALSDYRPHYPNAVEAFVNP